MSVLDSLLNSTVDRLLEAQAFLPGKAPDILKVDEIIQQVPTMVTLHSFRTSPFLIYVNDQTRDFYGFEENDLSGMNSFFYAKTFHPRTLYLLAHTYQFFFRKNSGTLNLDYRLKNAAGEYERVKGSSKGVISDDRGRLSYVLSITSREADLSLLTVILKLGLESLGGRQKECLGWLLRGHTNAQIGDEMGISARTVEKHLDAIYKEAGVSSRAEILRFKA